MQRYKKEQEEIKKTNDLIDLYNHTISHLITSETLLQVEEETKQVTYNFVQNELLYRCGIKINNLKTIIFKLKALKNVKYFLSNIIENPYDFIQEDFHLITFDKAETIRDRYGLDIPLQERCEKWICYHVLNPSVFVKDLTFKEKEKYTNTNHLWIYEELLNKKYKEYFIDARNNELIQEVKRRLCIKKNFYGVSFVTTNYLYNIEKNMGDTMIELYHDKEVEIDSKDFNNFIKEQNNSKENFEFTNEQIEAIKSCATNHFNIICGYPGTGKTTITNAALHYLSRYNDIKICLTSHTGLATSKLKKSVDERLQKEKLIGTLTKLIYDVFPKITSRYEQKIYEGKKHISTIYYSKLRPHVIIVDEFSMVDMLMFNRLLKYCQAFNCRLILLGDNQQLPPIGPGNPLRSLIDANKKHDLFNVSYLTNIKRQDGGILRDIILKMNKQIIKKNDFDNCSFIFKDQKEFIHRKDNENKINEEKFKSYLDTLQLNINETHFITPQGSKLFGHENMNKILQNYFNPINYLKDGTKEIKYSKKPYYIQTIHDGDKVMRTENNYTGDTIRANGDTGNVCLLGDDKVEINYHNDKKIIHRKDESSEILSIAELYDSIIPFYCNTVHKSQGSEYKTVVIFINKQFNFMLTRDGAWNLIYTAISRAKDKCIVIGDVSMFEKAQQYKEGKNITVFLEEFNENELSSDTEE